MNDENGTGLPELPEGYFWRVDYLREGPWIAGFQVQHVSRNKLQIGLVRKTTVTVFTTPDHWWERSKEVTREDERVVYCQPTQGTNPVAIRNAANSIMKKWAKEKKLKALIGDYPPKKLEA